MNDFSGIDLPVGLINKNYKQQPGNSRKCVECGKLHDTIVEDTRTGERLSEIDKCNDCLMWGFKFNLRNWKMKEQINSPDHYKGTQGIEVIDVIEQFGLNFTLGNCIKYILRAGKKENKLIDLKKAAWYLEREINKGVDNG